MKAKIGLITAVLFFNMICTNVFAQESLLDKAKNIIGNVNISEEYKALLGKTENALKDLKNKAKDIDTEEFKKILGSIEGTVGDKTEVLKKAIEKQLPGIIEEIKAQLEKTPNNTKLLIKLAIAYQFGAKYSLALTVAEKILTLEPENFNAAMIKAECYKLMGETEKGAVYLEKFMKEKINNPDLSKLLASLRMEMGQADKAIKELEASIGKFSGEKGLFEELAKAYGEAGKKGIQLFVDGKKLDFTKYGSVEPLTKNGVTMVPIRAVADCLKAKISYNPKTKIVTLIYKGKTITMKENENIAKINQKAIKVKTAAQNIKGRIMVPLRFISEQLSKTVDWFPFNKYGIVSLK